MEEYGKQAGQQSNEQQGGCFAGALIPRLRSCACTPLARFVSTGRSPRFTTEDLWKSRTSARTLFKLLLCAPGRQASRSQLAGILWPETDEDKARESLRSASKVLRKVLRTASGEELLEQRNQNTILKLASSPACGSMPMPLKI